MSTVSTDDVVEYIERDLARSQLQGNSGELQQLRRITAFLARVANDVGDSANQRRFLDLHAIADGLLRNQPLR